LIPFDQEEAGHHHDISFWCADGVTLCAGANATGKDLASQNFAKRAALYAKCFVEFFVCVRDGTRLWPEPTEEGLAGFNIPLVDKQDLGIVWVGRYRFFEVGNGFAAEDSAKVAQENEQGTLILPRIAESCGGEI